MMEDGMLKVLTIVLAAFLLCGAGALCVLVVTVIQMERAERRSAALRGRVEEG